jgi:hypothetical protein
MASSFTGLGTELMTTGENAGTWGTTTNTNLQIIEQISGGYTEQDIAGSADTTTLAVSDGSAGAVLAHRIIKFTGTITGNQIVTIPLDVQQLYVLVNGTSGAYTVQFKYASGSGSSVTFAATDKGTKLVYATADHATNPNLVDTGIASTGDHDLDGNELILDADADTSITADTDDQIDIKIAGADDFQFTANTFTAQAGSTIAAQALTATTVTASGIVKTDDTTEATSTTDGSLQTDGGLSVAKDAVFGDDVKLLSDSAVLSFGADSDTTLTHTDGTGLTLNSTNKLTFQDTGTYIHSNADGDLDVVSDGTAVDSINLESAGGITLDAGTAGSGIVYEDDGTEMARIHNSSSDVILETKVSDKDFLIKGNDGGSTVTALTLDMSAAGAATFNDKIIATELDISGNMDIDGTSNLDAVDIDGAVQLDATLTVGVDDQGYDVKLFGDTASAYMLWDTSADDLILGGAAGLIVPDGQFTLGSTAVSATAAEINLIDGGASTGTTAVADADGIITNDGGTMRLTTAATFKTYFQSGVSIAADDISAGDAAVTIGNGSTSADVTIDSGDDVVIDAAGGNIEFKDAGTTQLTLDMDGTSGAQVIQLRVDTDDLIFKQFDGTTVLTLDDDTTVKVATDLTVGDDLTLLSDSAVLGFGADTDTTLTHTDGTGLTLNSTNKLTFGDAATFINQSSDGVMTVAGEATIDLTASTAVLVSNDLKLDSDSAVLGFGADNDTTLTHTDGTGLTLNSTNKLCFNDASQFVQGSSATVLSLGATDEIDLTATAIDINGTCDISGTFSLAGTNITSTATEINKLDGVGTLAQAGKQTIWVPANAMTPTTSNGCADITAVETTAGRPDMYVLDFDKDSDEHAQFTVAFPKQWNLGTITYQAFWSGTANTGGVSWGLQGVACGDNDTIDVAYGTGVVVDDTEQGALEEVNVSPVSGAVTIAGSPADDQLCYFRFYRDVSDSNDNSSGDARLHGIKIFYTTDAANDD